MNFPTRKMNYGLSSSANDSSQSTAVFGAAGDYVTNLSVTITTFGRPVWMGLISDGTTATNDTGRVTTRDSGAGVADGQIAFLVGTTVLSQQSLANNNASEDTGVPGSAFSHIYFPVAGTYTFTVQFRVSNALDTIFVNFLKLLVYEM